MPKNVQSKNAAVSRQLPTELEPLTRHEMFVQGLIQIDQLDIDELQHGKIKTHDGKWPRGVVPTMPSPLAARITRELHKRLLAKFQEYGIDAIETITDVMYRGEGASAYQGQKDGVKRLDAAKYVLDRIVGPIPTKSENTTTVTVWEGLQESADLFVDVEVVEEKTDVQTPEPRPRPGRRRRRTQGPEGYVG